jgi:hypothetical protein
MRKWILPAAVAGLTLALAGVAIAKFNQVSKITFTAHRAGQSSGIKVYVHARDPAALGFKPKRATKLVIEFPSGTRFNLNTSLVTACTLTDKQITTTFGPSCPSDSQIGAGSAIVNAMPMAPKPGVDAKVKVFVSGSDRMFILVYNDQNLLPGTPPIIIHATVSGPQLTMKLPHVVYGKSNKFKFPGVTAVIALLQLNIPAMGSGSNALLTAGSCSKHRFVVKAHFTYADHGKAILNSRSSCS